MEDLTKRVINCLLKAATNARNNDDAKEAADLAEILGEPIAQPTPPPAAKEKNKAP